MNVIFTMMKMVFTDGGSLIVISPLSVALMG